MKLLLFLALPLYLLDQITKWLVLSHIGYEEIIPVIPGFFSLVQVHNTGAAFGMLSNNNLFFILLSSVAVLVLAWFWWRKAFVGIWAKVAVALLFAGIFGNLTDRILHGFVVDFLNFVLPLYGPWPAFNVADSCICVAAGLLIFSSFRDGKNEKVETSSPL